jgi:hypothetical protein
MIRGMSQASCQVDRNDCLGPLGNHGLGGLGGDVAAVATDFREDRRRAHQPHARDRRHERPRGHDHLVTRADAEGAKREFERQRAIGEGNAMGAAETLCTRLLEGVHIAARPLVHPAGLKHFYHGGHLIVA